MLLPGKGLDYLFLRAEMKIKSIAQARFLIAAAAAVGILSATPVHASVVTMTFTGTYDSSQSTGGPVDGIAAVPGTTLTAFGTVSFDSTALSLITDGLHASPPGDEQIYAGPVTFTATVGLKSYPTTTSAGNVVLSNANYPSSQYHFEVDGGPPAGTSVTMALDSESSSKLFGNSADPGSFLSQNNLYGEFYLQDPSGSKLVFDVTMNVSAVPEPSTWAMMILGFLGVGFVAYRKKSAPRFA